MASILSNSIWKRDNFSCFQMIAFLSNIWIPGLNPTNKNLSFWEIFRQKSGNFEPTNFFQKIRNFQTKYFGAASGQISENFLRNILIGTQFENMYVEIFRNLRTLSEFWEFFFVGRIEPKSFVNRTSSIVLGYFPSPFPLPYTKVTPSLSPMPVTH